MQLWSLDDYGDNGCGGCSVKDGGWNPLRVQSFLRRSRYTLLMGLRLALSSSNWPPSNGNTFARDCYGIYLIGYIVIGLLPWLVVGKSGHHW
jgi:hypothetical protein